MKTKPILPNQNGEFITMESLFLDSGEIDDVWVEDGREKPQQITFGKVLKLTGINRIPLRKVK